MAIGMYDDMDEEEAKAFKAMQAKAVAKRNKPLPDSRRDTHPENPEHKDISPPDSRRDTHPENPEHKDISPPANHHPCGDLLDQGKRIEYINICLPLYQASVIGDWEAVENILSISPEFEDDLLGYSITEGKDTPLHIGVYSQSIKFVENLVNQMTDQQLALQDIYGRTPLYCAAGVGDVDMVRVMVQRRPQLVTIRDKSGTLPITMAALFGKRDMVAYLYGWNKSMAANNGWKDEDIHKVFLKCIQADLFDSAIKILDDNNETGFPKQHCAREVLYKLARKTYAFKDKKSWKNSIITWMRPTKESSVAIQLLRKICKNILERPTDEINEILKGPFSQQTPFIAAEMGNTKFLVELIRGYPELMWKENDNKQNIFHIAVSHRYESIYNLLYEMGSMHNYMTHHKDKDGNNMLHLLGILKTKTPHEDVSGAVFQMQRELLWFKEVDSKVPTYCREEKNHDGRTPLQLFIENHQDMASKGEKWMKETANQCMVVAALVTTVVFSAAFTIPGGYDQSNGLPVFLKDGPFMAFVMLDAISLILSSASILMFLSILTSRYAQEDFLVSLPKKLMIGLTTLFLSIITMMVAFSVSFYVLYPKKFISVPIIISVGALVPIFLYMKLQFPLLVDTYGSTFGSRYLFKPKTRVLFYRHPRF
ncbi:hypothetical protein OSB04_013941 [Centaurea solstitialis]|uniref:PGG domain-containing protein n=1 Tax=Centaurea solstitialis TaxID=347529 RepID=A0AA38WFH4_9ASTR|nr:hypothetical protein OSB04_013941 [Centaurea solstitialis]